MLCMKCLDYELDIPAFPTIEVRGDKYGGEWGTSIQAYSESVC